VNNFEAIDLRSNPTVAHLDYRDLFSPSFAEAVVANRFGTDVIALRDNDGHSIRSIDDRRNGFLEYCTFGDDVLLVVSEVQRREAGQSVQITSDGDWLHMQFRVAGGGCEQIGGLPALETPEGSFTMVRCPSDSTTIRDYQSASLWSAVCLYIRPRSIGKFFGVSESALGAFEWISDARSTESRAHTVPLDIRSRTVIQEVRSNEFNGEFRRAFFRAKVLELFTVAVERLVTQGDEDRKAQGLGSSERQKLAMLAQIMEDEIERPLTLGYLARKVGTNRTRLAEIFKQCHGITVQHHWRKLRLDHAMKLLAGESIPVTEVAARIGYSNVSSLSRAFAREFGVLPKDVKPNKGRSALRKKQTLSS